MDSKEKIENVKLDLQNVDTMIDVKENQNIYYFLKSFQMNTTGDQYIKIGENFVRNFEKISTQRCRFCI